MDRLALHCTIFLTFTSVALSLSDWGSIMNTGLTCLRVCNTSHPGISECSCTSVGGSYCASRTNNKVTCTCSYGYHFALDEGSGTARCEETDECEESPCTDACKDLIGRYQCFCHSRRILENDQKTCRDAGIMELYFPFLVVGGIFGVIFLLGLIACCCIFCCKQKNRETRDDEDYISTKEFLTGLEREIAVAEMEKQLLEKNSMSKRRSSVLRVESLDDVTDSPNFEPTGGFMPMTSVNEQNSTMFSNLPPSQMRNSIVHGATVSQTAMLPSNNMPPGFQLQGLVQPSGLMQTQSFVHPSGLVQPQGLIQSHLPVHPQGLVQPQGLAQPQHLVQPQTFQTSPQFINQ